MSQLALSDSLPPDPTTTKTKARRQWDAWTREEEQNFFEALRQVGKNFEKITSRVQSKNKDQVRHYYYRVIKRMNRILPPTLTLDAKNATYVNSAMLRWWALLEKHSCSASKLRLKPRRFKTFVTALEHQLLKDHKRAKTKKTTTTASTLRKHTVGVHKGLAESGTSGSGTSKAALGDSQSSETAGHGQRTAVKRKSASNGSRKSGPKFEAKRPPRPRKKATGQLLPGTSAAFLELGITDKMEKDFASGLPIGTHGLGAATMSSLLSQVACSPQTASLSSTMAIMSPSLKGAVSNVHEGLPRGLVIDPELRGQVNGKSLALNATRCNNCSNLKCNAAEEAKNDMASAKLKLQLFPFDDFIRKALEQDGHNPHLELTLKARKSISSVLHHLMQKWGRSGIALGELRLFPFNTQWSNVSSCQSWSYEDLNMTAADVHAALGTPVVFRLRYAWLSSHVLESSAAVLQEQQIHTGKAANETGHCLSEEISNPGMKNLLKHNLTYLSASQSSCLGASTVPSLEPCMPFEEIDILPVSAARCAKDEARQCVQPEDSVYKIVGVDGPVPVPSMNPACPSLSSEHHHVRTLPFSVGEPAASPELDTDKLVAEPVSDLLSFAEEATEEVNRPNCKEHGTSSQISGCAWLYESNDGFAQQLWTHEDTLRSSSGVSIAQMDWVDSLTNISVSELLGEASRAMFSAPIDGQPSICGQNQPTCLDSLGFPSLSQDLPLQAPQPMGQSSSTIWGGDETCDAFAFQRLEGSSRETVNVSVKETSPSSMGFDVTFPDFRSMTCWREGDLSMALEVGHHLQSSQSQDFLFGGETSMGLGGLIEALGQSS